MTEVALTWKITQLQTASVDYKTQLAVSLLATFVAASCGVGRCCVWSVCVIVDPMGVFSVTRIWPICVTPAKNNFVCVSIVKRDKRMRDAGRCARRYPAA
jgi:predicted Co/Zn/Cd cation transporter (cation efflux family)